MTVHHISKGTVTPDEQCSGHITNNCCGCEQISYHIQNNTLNVNFAIKCLVKQDFNTFTWPM